MITRRGWGLLAGAVLLAVAGRLLGVEELFVLAAGATALVVAGVVAVATGTVSLRATRELHPTRVHAGSDSRVELALRNTGSRRTPVVSIRDPFDGGRRQARFLLAPVATGETARAAYRLPTDRRGVFRLGPLEATRADSFGLAAVRRELAPATHLTVYPLVEVVAPLPHTVGHDPYAGADHPNAIALRGEDFYALRPYVVGDDLRRVHWPSTARLDELMIRQDEMPWQGRVTVLLDNRRRSNTAESLELAVSAAASIVMANWGRRALVRLVTASGTESGWASGLSQVEAILEHLATVQAERAEHFAGVVRTLHGSGNGGALAAVTAGASATDLEALARLRSRFGSVTVVVFDPSSWGAAPAGRIGADHPGIARVTADVPFVTAWNRAVARPRAGALR